MFDIIQLLYMVLSSECCRSYMCQHSSDCSLLITSRRWSERAEERGGEERRERETGGDKRREREGEGEKDREDGIVIDNIKMVESRRERKRYTRKYEDEWK